MEFCGQSHQFTIELEIKTSTKRLSCQFYSSDIHKYRLKAIKG